MREIVEDPFSEDAVRGGDGVPAKAKYDDATKVAEVATRDRGHPLIMPLLLTFIDIDVTTLS